MCRGCYGRPVTPWQPRLRWHPRSQANPRFSSSEALSYVSVKSSAGSISAWEKGTKISNNPREPLAAFDTSTLYYKANLRWEMSPWVLRICDRHLHYIMLFYDHMINPQIRLRSSLIPYPQQEPDSTLAEAPYLTSKITSSTLLVTVWKVGLLSVFNIQYSQRSTSQQWCVHEGYYLTHCSVSLCGLSKLRFQTVTNNCFSSTLIRLSGPLACRHIISHACTCRRTRGNDSQICCGNVIKMKSFLWNMPNSATQIIKLLWAVHGHAYADLM